MNETYVPVLDYNTIRLSPPSYFLNGTMTDLISTCTVCSIPVTRSELSIKRLVLKRVTYKNFSSLNCNLRSHSAPHKCPLTISKCPLSVLRKCPSYREFGYSKMTKKRPGPPPDVRLIEVSVKRELTVSTMCLTGPPKYYHPLLEKEKLVESTVRRILPSEIADSVRPTGSRLAHLYGLPKTHKRQLAMRPILSATGTYNYALAKWLDAMLKPLSVNEHTITDIFAFTNEIRGVKINPGEILVSYDVSSLFTNVPLDETIDILAWKAFENNWFNDTYDLNLTRTDLVDLLHVTTKGQLFQFDGALYEQTDGVAMGSPLGPLLANVFMCSIEGSLKSQGKLPDFYRRYVDDTPIRMPDLAAATQFLYTLNHAHSAVSFTMEVEKNGMLPFLGVQLLNRAPCVETKVYVKPTNTGLLLHYHSHVDSCYKHGLLVTMLDRAHRLSSSWAHFSEECERLREVFRKLRYQSINQFIKVIAWD